jgi:cell division protein FtsZ
MEKRSSIKDSALRNLFSVTEPAHQDHQQPGMVRSGEGGVQPRVASIPGEFEQESPEIEEAPQRGRVTQETVDSAHTDEGRRTLIQPSRSPFAVIRVVGVGGAGTNAVNRMIEAGIQGVEFIAINTDAQALAMCDAAHKLRIGRELTKGLGGGNDPKIGRDAAMAAYEEIKTILKGSDMVFVTAGEGGGTGTGAAPVVAEISRAMGALTLGVVTFPFAFEGKRRGMQALEGLRALRQRADTVIVVPNQKLLEISDKATSMVDALRLADDVLRQGVQGVCDLVTVPGLINLDLADVRTVMMGAGTAHMGVGRSRGEQRAVRAAEMALKSALLDTSIQGARGILLNVSGGKDLTLHEIIEVAEAVAAAAEPDATLIFGAVVHESLNDSVCVTLVAAGFDSTNDEVLTAQVEGRLKPVRAAETKPVESRSSESRFSGTRSLETRFSESRFESRPTEKKSPARDSGDTDWDRPSREPRSTPRRRGEDDDLDVPTFLR